MALPRGSARLIQTVVQTAKVPVIETGAGICHLYIEEDADLNMAVNIAENAKIQRPGVCNAIECIIVNKKIAADYGCNLILEHKTDYTVTITGSVL